MARCSTRAPVRRGVGDDRPRSGSRQGCRLLFARAGCPVEKPGPGSRTCRAGCPASAKRGAPLFGYFLSGKREKVTRPPQEGESSCLYDAHRLSAGTEPGPDITRPRYRSVLPQGWLVSLHAEDAGWGNSVIETFSLDLSTLKVSSPSLGIRPW